MQLQVEDDSSEEWNQVELCKKSGDLKKAWGIWEAGSQPLTALQSLC